MENKPITLVVLVSGSGSNLQAIIDQIEDGRLNARIAAVISNKANAYGLQRARAHGIITEVIDHSVFDTREEFDQILMGIIDSYAPDLVCLAGFMRILSDAFTLHYLGRMINIHPSLLPAYKGVNTHARALSDGVKEHGASIHFVTPELDSGPIIIRAYVPIRSEDTPDTLAARVLTQEHEIYPAVIQWFSEGRLQLINHKVVFDDVVLKRPIEHRILT